MFHIGSVVLVFSVVLVVSSKNSIDMLNSMKVLGVRAAKKTFPTGNPKFSVMQGKASPGICVVCLS